MATANPSEPLSRNIPGDFSLEAETSVHRAVRRLLMLLIMAYCVAAIIWEFDADELQSMTTAIAMARGDVLYVDVWDNHGPALYYALEALVRAFPAEHHAVLLPARLAMLVFTLLTAWLVHRLARIVRSDLAFFADLACVLFLMSRIVRGAGYEIRPDVPFMFLWAWSLLVFFKAVATGKWKYWLLAGTLLGLGFLFSIKTLFLGVAAGAMFAALVVAWRRLPIREVALFGAGTAIGPVAMAAALGIRGNLQAFWKSYYGQNSDRGGPDIEDAMESLWGWDPIFMPLLAVALGFAAWAIWRKRVNLSVALLAVATAVYLALFVGVLPTHHPQSALPLIVPGAVLVAWALDRLARMPRVRLGAARMHIRTGKAVSILLTLLVIAHLADAGWYRFRAFAVIREGQRLQACLPRDAGIVEGYGIPMYQTRPLRYKVFVNTIGDRSRDGALDCDLVAETDRLDIPYARWDKRVHRLGGEYWRFLTRNYLPIRQKSFLAAGRIVEKPGTMRIRIAGVYHWRGPVALRVDGQIAPNPLRLEDGSHRVEWEGNAPLAICVASPEQWMPLEPARFWIEYGRQNQYNKRKSHMKKIEREIWGTEDDD